MQKDRNNFLMGCPHSKRNVKFSQLNPKQQTTLSKPYKVHTHYLLEVYLAHMVHGHQNFLIPGDSSRVFGKIFQNSIHALSVSKYHGILN